MGCPVKGFITTFNVHDSVRCFSQRVAVSMEQPTVYHLQSTVLCDWILLTLSIPGVIIMGDSA